MHFSNTVGMIAVWDAADQWHLAAELGYKKLLLRGHPLVTTEMVLYECRNAAARRPYRPRVNSRPRRGLMEDQLLVVPTSEELEEAWASYDRGVGGEADIVGTGFFYRDAASRTDPSLYERPALSRRGLYHALLTAITP